MGLGHGQVRIPPLAMSGYDEKKNPYRGRCLAHLPETSCARWEDLRSPRVWFKD